MSAIATGSSVMLNLVSNAVLPPGPVECPDSPWIAPVSSMKATANPAMRMHSTSKK